MNSKWLNEFEQRIAMVVTGLNREVRSPIVNLDLTGDDDIVVIGTRFSPERISLCQAKLEELEEAATHLIEALWT
jgi:hypothetical protein